MATYSPSQDQVKAALNELLSWSELVRSPQLAKFLSHIVEAKLRGEEAGIKAYSIAVDVLGRPPSFDPQTDPIVRVQARRLRGLLQEFDRQNLGRSGARITLPVGRYVPEFELVDAGEGLVAVVDETEGDVADSPPSDVSRTELGRLQSFWAQAFAAGILVLLLGLLLYALQVFRNQPPVAEVTLPPTPKVYLATYDTPPGQLDVFAGRLADQLSALLARAEDLEIGFDDGATPIERRAGVKMLTGAIVPGDKTLRIDSILRDGISGEVVWGNSIVVPRPGADDTIVAATAARKIARQLRPVHGPIHAGGLQWVVEHANPLPGVTSYVCLLAYRAAREELDAAAVDKAGNCYERLLMQMPEDATALAAKAWLDARLAMFASRPGERVIDATIDALSRVAERARRLAPNSSFVHQQLANIEAWRGNFSGAQRNYAIALGFDPLNTDARAGYAVTFARLNQWGEAARQAQLSIADTALAPAWYYALPTLLAFRAGNYDETIVDGRIAAPASEVGIIAALSAAGLTGNEKVINEMRPRLMAAPSLQEAGIMPWLLRRVGSDPMVSKLADGLRAAGVSEATLTGPF